MKMSDEIIMERIKNGDEEALGEVMKKYKDKIYNFIYKFIRDRERALELAQEVFVRVYFKADTYKGTSSISTWIYKIATNLSISELRRRKIVKWVSFDSISPSWEKEKYSENYESYNLLESLLKKIKSKYKIPLVLKEIEGFSIEEVANMLNIPEGTVKSRINRAKKTIKQELEAMEKKISPQLKQNLIF
ncbi:MAG: RNA polymerase sigma factor [Acidobacteriota bacterium]